MIPLIPVVYLILKLCAANAEIVKQHSNVIEAIVEIEQGILKGEFLNRSTGNGQYYSFKGIPYAAPPVGKLRFMAPRPPFHYSSVRDATVHGSICPQVKLGPTKYISGKEDCLFLNVYTPALNPKTPFPVMFFIHGGSFTSGSGDEDEYGPDFLLDHNVILVTINFRLGALGFLSLDIKEVPGNAGLKDQVAALQWVKKNIVKFGGNPNNITIFGQNSGGASVTLHALSPMSEGLFQKAIAMSGVCFNAFAEAFEPKKNGFLLAYSIGLHTKDPYDAFLYLQNASVEAIITANRNLLALDVLREYVSQAHTFAPVVEKDFGDQHFLLEKPEQLLKRGKTNPIELMLGYTAQEGVTKAVALRKYIFDVFPYYHEMLVPPRFSLKLGSAKIFEIADCIKNHYFGDKEISLKNLKDFIVFYSYLVYVVDIYRFLEMWTNAGQKAYFYEFSCFSERNIYGKTGLKFGLISASHLDDLMYVFDGRKYSFSLNKHSGSYIKIVQTCALFTNFAKYGNPTPNSRGTIWRKYDRDENILHIDLHLTLGVVNMTEINFWKRMYYYAEITFS